MSEPLAQLHAALAQCEAHWDVQNTPIPRLFQSIEPLLRRFMAQQSGMNNVLVQVLRIGIGLEHHAIETHHYHQQLLAEIAGSIEVLEVYVALVDQASTKLLETATQSVEMLQAHHERMLAVLDTVNRGLLTNAEYWNQWVTQSRANA